MGIFEPQRSYKQGSYSYDSVYLTRQMYQTKKQMAPKVIAQVIKTLPEAQRTQGIESISVNTPLRFHIQLAT